MELADVPDSKSGGSDTVRVRPPPPAPERQKLERLQFEFYNTQIKQPRESGCLILFLFEMPYIKSRPSFHKMMGNIKTQIVHGNWIIIFFFRNCF